jgi:ribosomal protein S19E (S16A)
VESVLNLLNNEMKQILVFLNLNRKVGSTPTSISEITRVVKGQTAQYRRGGQIKHRVLDQIRKVLQTLESRNLIEAQDDGYQITKNGITIAEQILETLLETEQPPTIEDDPFSRHFWRLLGF